jgi:hypothetical protein
VVRSNIPVAVLSSIARFAITMLTKRLRLPGTVRDWRMNDVGHFHRVGEG